MKLNVLIIAFLFVAGLIPQALAQSKNLALEDLMNRKLYPQSLQNLQWRNNDKISWIAKSKLVQQETASSVVDTILSLEKLNESVAATGVEKLKAFPMFRWLDDATMEFTSGNKLLHYQPASGIVTVINSFGKDPENLDLDPATGAAAYTRDNNLYVSVNSFETAITNDAEKNIVNGQSVHRNEFGIDKGTFWSPKGNYLAFYRMDQTMVTDYPLVNINERIATVENIKYPMAGMASHHVTLGVYNVQLGTLIYLKTGEPKEQYLTNISWSPDEKYIYIAVINRDQDYLWLNKYDASTGAFVKTLFEETDKEYVEPMNGLTFLKNDPSRFLWQSRRDGWNHLYLYDQEGNLARQLTSGAWEVTQLLGTDPAETRVFYLSTEAGPLERQLYATEIKTGKTSRLTREKGTHSILLSPDARQFTSRLTSLEVASRITLNDIRKNTNRVIFEDLNPLKDYQLGETSFITLKTSEGTDLYARLIKPLGFDPAKKYPVLIYVYGGPHSQLVTDTWLGGAGLFLNFMASKGYLVFTLDNRGTASRGAAFEQCIHRQLGKLEMEDQMTGVNYLKSLPYVNADRIGLDGWSYGGFMTLMLKLKNPGQFRVASCGGPVIDWQYYEVMYGERYMDTPEQNPEGYKAASSLNFVDKLEGKLLVMHGAQDNTVVWQNSLRFIQQCIQSGKQVDYFVYPHHEHNVGGKDRLHMFRKLAEYYDQNL